MPRLVRRLALACLVNMTLVLYALAAPRIWVALTEEGAAYAEVATVLRAELAGRFEVTASYWPALAWQSEAPELIIAVGVGALDGALDSLRTRPGRWESVPLLAVMVPRAVFEARRAAGAVIQRRAFSAVFLDQPLARQLALIRLALPQAWRVGVLAGPQTRPQLPALDREATRLGLEIFQSMDVDGAAAIYPALKEVLDGADVVLALPDPLIYHAANLQNILLATYRARKPLVAFSPSYVKAGAILGVYATPSQLARSAATLLRAWQPGYPLPAPQMSKEFEVASNPRVAASLGIMLDSAEALTAALWQLETRR